MKKDKKEIDITHYPEMTKWFSFSVLKKALKRLILSSLFGEYADRRLIQAALSIENEPYTHEVESEEEFWIDYVADLGDGFDSTYPIAYLLGKKEIVIQGLPTHLPQGEILIMGGDQVYPLANYEDYCNKLLMPYSFSFPKTGNACDKHPSLFLIPGNHDWYDGLSLFLAFFCRGKNQFFGGSSWRTQQTRSYFAIKLPNNWWIWGVDTQLGEDIDTPQANYFKEIAKTDKKEKINNIKIVLCVSSPTWLEVDKKRDKYNKGIKFIVNSVIKKEIPEAKIYALLTGDTHHYNRFTLSESGTEFITAGGGGAFLHPTHDIPNCIKNIEWGEDKCEILNLAVDQTTGKKSCYPQKKESKDLARGNKKFLLKNKSFSLILSAFYALAILLLLIPPVSNKNLFNLSPVFSTVYSPAFLIVLASMLFIGYKYALKDDPPSISAIVSGLVHGFCHFIIIFIFTVIFKYSCNVLYFNPPCIWIGGLGYIIALVFTSIVAGVLGTILWGMYLLIVSYIWGLQSNDAFSAMRLTGYKNFLRLHFKKDQLTIYPIGLKNCPQRNKWKINDNYKHNQYEPKYKINKLNIELIESPIVISKINIK